MSATLKSDRLFRPAAVHALRHVSADVPDLRPTKRERNSPRGRIALMRAIADDELAVSREFAEEMSYCLGCLACQTACPAGVNYAELFETARNDIETAGASGLERRFWRALTLRFLFHASARPACSGPAAARLPALRDRRDSFGAAARCVFFPRHCAAWNPGAARRRRSSHRLIAREERPAGAVRHRVALLTGCVQDLVFASVNRDTVDVLLANGCAVDTPAVQPCCGSLHAHNGDLDGARILARRMIDLFPPDRYDAIITNAGGCGSHLRRYGPLLADDPAYAERARAWDGKLRDVHEWLGEIGCRAPEPQRHTGRRAGFFSAKDGRRVPRLLSPGARAEDCASAARVARADSWRDVSIAPGIDVVLRGGRECTRSPSLSRRNSCSRARCSTLSRLARASSRRQIRGVSCRLRGVSTHTAAGFAWCTPYHY